MIILGIETSCDETSIGLLQDGHTVLGHVIASQAELHSEYGGVVPELASRKHLEAFVPILDEVLAQAGEDKSVIDAVAVAHGPGLIGSVVVGVAAAKALAFGMNKPLVGVNHLEAHVLSPRLEHQGCAYPYLSLLVSGGHTILTEVRGFREYCVLGQTRDDAAGEAFDKVAKMLGLGYPGGPIIDRLAQTGDSNRYNLPRPMLHQGYEFSFSGLKTAVRNLVEAPDWSPEDIPDLCASFQAALVEVCVKKLRRAAQQSGIKRISAAGGVACNSLLRQELEGLAQDLGGELFIPSPKFCMDNGAMIAYAGYEAIVAHQISDLTLEARSRFYLTEIE